tara:strand:- start:94 stop:1305 length:1212 start_codon:yes stop_codon:yes gene_type:complete
MINFSKVARQLEEDRFQRNQAGNQGTQAEEDIVNIMRRHVKPNSNIIHLGTSSGNKTDFYEDNGSLDKNRGYSVKSTKMPDVPNKVQQSGNMMGPKGAYRKLMMPQSGADFIKNRSKSRNNLQINNEAERNKFLDVMKSDPVIQSFVMNYGTDFIHPGTGKAPNLKSFQRFLTQGDNGGELNQEQLELLGRINDRGQNNPFMTPGEMEEFFPDHHKSMLNHLGNNKSDIFNQMVRQHEPMFAGSSYDYGDPKPLERMIHLRGTQGGEMLPGKFDIRDISDPKVEEAMKKLDWFQDDNNFYLAEDETDDINRRILDVHPHTSRTDSWTFNPKRPQPGGTAKPGLLKATMGIDEEMLDRVFGESMYSADLERNGEGYRMSNIVNRINNGRTLNEKFINWRKEIND